MQEQNERLACIEAEKQALHDTLVSTEALIKQARAEHASEVRAAAASADADVARLRDEVATLTAAVR